MWGGESYCLTIIVNNLDVTISYLLIMNHQADQPVFFYCLTPLVVSIHRDSSSCCLPWQPGKSPRFISEFIKQQKYLMNHGYLDLVRSLMMIFIHQFDDEISKPGRFSNLPGAGLAPLNHWAWKLGRWFPNLKADCGGSRSVSNAQVVVAPHRLQQMCLTSHESWRFLSTLVSVHLLYAIVSSSRVPKRYFYVI